MTAAETPRPAPDSPPEHLELPTVDGQLLYTPAQASQRLIIKESWLRRKAGLRQIPCTFLGKHLRFSDADLRAIVGNGSTTTQRRRSSHRRHR
ncbi:DNA-binding protein [Amycolatopsis sp. NPDC051071]|uniref:DNA-binding protein n=1 Tax=Amycolatopsis sp. NPDC051071 TaxID=3154637 RepID=UPI0034412EC2